MYLLCTLLAFPLAGLHRFVYGAVNRHLYCLVIGLVFAYSCFGSQLLVSLGSSLVVFAYLLLPHKPFPAIFSLLFSLPSVSQLHHMHARAQTLPPRFLRLRHALCVRLPLIQVWSHTLANSILAVIFHHISIHYIFNITSAEHTRIGMAILLTSLARR
jgi:hypothetical protein